MKRFTIIFIILFIIFEIIILLAMIKPKEKPIILDRIKQEEENIQELKEQTNFEEPIPEKDETQETPIQEEPTQQVEEKHNTNTYKLTHYGFDCSGCSGITASGYNVHNTIYYNDNQYGTLRIVATSSSIPLYSIIRIYNYRYDGDITAIVLDRGVSNGVIDLLVESESKSSQLGIQNVEVEILRSGK